MRKSQIIIAALGVSALAISTSATAGNPEEKIAGITDWYAGAVAEFVSCNTESIGKYSAKGHRGFYPDSGTLHDETSEEAKQANIDFCENGGVHELEYEVTDVVMMKGGALILGTGHYKRTEPEGGVSVDTDYTFTEVVVKEDDSWKIKHTHIGMIVDMSDGSEDASE